mmetsp:Transcript_110558/g.323481  ORF Transcript_110558/g.323481 Transcript_110558/m.323481 type:complete len:157 (-) Transcript_110558:35-505(-)
MNTVLPRVQELSGAKGKVPFVAVVREVAPTKKVKEDAGPQGLGVGEFQTKYFGGKPVYWDEEQLFVKEMGDRKIKFKFKAPWWKPWAIWGEIQEGLKKLKDKGVEGNFVGDGFTQGGVLCIGPGTQGVTYAHFEENDPDVGMPADDIVKGVDQFML